jgi:hypothetical protein
MKILFDQGTPAPLRGALADHAVSTAYEMGWSGLDNGALLRAADQEFDALIGQEFALSARHKSPTTCNSHPPLDQLAKAQAASAGNQCGR